jgi:subtilisin family serine protease
MNALCVSQKTFLTMSALVLAFTFLAGGDQDSTGGVPKKRVTSMDQLPNHSYKISGTITDMFNRVDAFAAFARQVRQDIVADLAAYEINDNATLREYYDVLLILDILEGCDEAAIADITRLRELSDKPAEKLFKGLVNQAMIEARRRVAARSEASFQDAFVRVLSEMLDKLPWDTVGGLVTQTKGSMEMISKNFILGTIQTTNEPGLRKTGCIDAKSARMLVRYYFVSEMIIPIKEKLVGVYDNYIKNHRVAKADIWKDRRLDLSAAQNLSTVVVAVWDTGVDTALFPDRIFTNPNEKVDGRDNDGNGFVDDIHGIAYDLNIDKTTALLYRPQGDPGQFSADVFKGLCDINVGADSPEAAALKNKMASMKPEQVKSFQENLTQQIMYTHGTLVASMIIAGNPYARILAARYEDDYREVSRPLTLELAEKTARMYREVVDYFKGNGVRVVNMSWGVTLKSLIKDLEANGYRIDPTERKKLALQTYAILRDGFYAALKGAPEILFVCACGNGNNDAFFEGHLPVSLDLPNIMPVGAADPSGEKSSFSNFGKGVRIFAEGESVAFVVPGGKSWSGSGTSIAAPIVTNLAAKLLALSPRLKVAEIVDLISKGADLSKDGRFLLLNPKRSVALLQSK